MSTDTRVLELNHGPDNPRNSEGSFATLSDGRIMFVYSRYRGESSSDHGRADLAARYSSDEGKTWSTDDRTLVEGEGDLNVMSVSLLQLQDGRLAMFYLRKNNLMSCYACMRTSTDDGETWSEPTRCIPAPGYFVVNNDRIIQLKSGRILIPAGLHRAKFDTTEVLPGGLDGRAIALYFYSDDAGKTWQESKTWWTLPVASGSGMQEPGAVELNDGSLFGWARTDTGTQWKQTSDDQGETWSPPEPAPEFPSPCSPLSIKRIPCSKHLVAVWNDTSRREGMAADPARSWGRTPHVVAISKDEGASWEHHMVIENKFDHGYCYTAIHFAGDAILLAYCCGGGETSRTLQNTCIRRIPLESLYDN